MSDMLYILGSSLAQAAGKDELLCRGVLRMTVINSVEHLRQMSDPIKATTETKIHMAKMTYQDWKAIIEGPALSRNLAIMGIKDMPTITAQLMQTLVEQQSLFTMTAR
ncbi:MAG TPA: hypothetical protein VHP14_20490 [Anaerolineales bacterium]|nr:hypothetical protein [Anaerolineales bacterium]